MMNLFIPKGIKIGSLTIAFYAICIIIGAIVAYQLSRHYLKKKGYDPNAIENLFYVAFPSGIIGARIWWMIAERQPIQDIYKIWQGGLAIQGGVLAGAAVGIIFMITRRKNIPVLLATDCIVPTILVAQAIGRWGNFFNQEVYGYCVDKWNWLPPFISDRLSIALNSAGDGWATSNWTGDLFNGGDGYYYLCDGGASKMVLPLFLIEGLLNLAGFFIIVYGIPALFKFLSKKTNDKISLANGDLMCCYLMWYGTVRLILEPLRNEKFIMGVDGGVGSAKSMVMSIIFIVMGVLGIVGCHLFKYFWPKRKVLDTNVISGSEASKDSASIAEINKENEDINKENENKENIEENGNKKD